MCFSQSRSHSTSSSHIVVTKRRTRPLGKWWNAFGVRQAEGLAGRKATAEVRGRRSWWRKKHSFPSSGGSSSDGGTHPRREFRIKLRGPGNT